MGLQPRFELLIEDTEEQEPERERIVVMRGGLGEGLASLSRPREAMSSMKEGRAAIWADVGRSMRRRKDGLQRCLESGRP